MFIHTLHSDWMTEFLWAQLFCCTFLPIAFLASPGWSILSEKIFAIVCLFSFIKILCLQQQNLFLQDLNVVKRQTKGKYKSNRGSEVDQLFKFIKVNKNVSFCKRLRETSSPQSFLDHEIETFTKIVCTSGQTVDQCLKSSTFSGQPLTNATNSKTFCSSSEDRQNTKNHRHDDWFPYNDTYENTISQFCLLDEILTFNHRVSLPQSPIPSILLFVPKPSDQLY